MLECFLPYVFTSLQVETLTQGNSVNIEKPLDIPKELWMMVDHLFRNAIKQVRIYVDFCIFTLLPYYFGGSYNICIPIFFFKDINSLKIF